MKLEARGLLAILDSDWDGGRRPTADGRGKHRKVSIPYAKISVPAASTVPTRQTFLVIARSGSGGGLVRRRIRDGAWEEQGGVPRADPPLGAERVGGRAHEGRRRGVRRVQSEREGGGRCGVGVPHACHRRSHPRLSGVASHKGFPGSAFPSLYRTRSSFGSHPNPPTRQKLFLRSGIQAVAIP